MNSRIMDELADTFTTQAVIRRWGNSRGIRLSKEIMAMMQFKEDDKVKISICNGKMTIEKLNRSEYLNLVERLESFYGKPIDEIYVENTQEVDTGAPVGNELW